MPAPAFAPGLLLVLLPVLLLVYSWFTPGLLLVFLLVYSYFSSWFCSGGTGTARAEAEQEGAPSLPRVLLAPPVPTGSWG